ncbi:MAG: putative toxin-antitoxin system toxin component, PIN family [Omnitrophica bacterium RIFCSPLOWO2_12_FULL_44_17]|uniref:Putative toxin-antitoxin system toxin component, PIN family n=1 Tax=Candidatus Danuiimicrobium aquiferis TaxID=1801832 RepID=A0A1G1KW87_9BACT|nr:MAG: putative toxin-antitoxin system toxin component, PIN family [Omnitrophica bacterium RIFCSPHIGHO2_02_FULL_45_28]OGW88318.1 MAG: putative toxin-antitoxin system toxin component, PIN family [Omnitrophica bacterium RIFCSPHIGHO2_12_FULL_44_12]OGW97135.1 MAG: putative toxin-antitoxin system toxin component, PIN family [Omnitrophica bacterium RIFCSPLOWO2_12_FULL_44_17]OGX03874.1 MAG: putative toxin-antitoxin system toxin component, PIN family [Omnitrophica bacterium RIFCSPLOWO2_02_FULL_44_11]
MKVVVDTNVLIAAFLTSGTAFEVLEVVLEEKIGVLSPYILNEFEAVLKSKKFGFPVRLVDEFVKYLKTNCSIIAEDKRFNPDFSDAADRKILALCQTIGADMFLTGDKELLALKQIGQTPIVSPSEFWKQKRSI